MGMREMAQNIRVDSLAVTDLVNSIRNSAGDYVYLKTGNISEPDPVPGSTLHDNICSKISKALKTWDKLSESDAVATERAFKGLADADASIASGM